MGGRWSTSALLAALAVAAPAAADMPCPGSDVAPSTDDVAQVSEATLCAMNQQRAAAGLHPLRRDARLDRSAQYHADDMAFFRFFAHQRPGGPSLLTRIKATGYFAHVGGLYTENLADAPDGDATAGAVVAAWMASEHHRTNLMLPAFRDAGIAVEPVPPDEAFYPDRPSVLYVVDFGRRYTARSSICARRRRAHTRRPAGAPRRVCTRHRSRRSGR